MKIPRNRILSALWAFGFLCLLALLWGFFGSQLPGAGFEEDPRQPLASLIRPRAGASLASFSGRVGALCTQLQYSLQRPGRMDWIPVDLSAPPHRDGVVTLQLRDLPSAAGSYVLGIRSRSLFGRWRSHWHRFELERTLEHPPFDWVASRSESSPIRSDHGIWERRVVEGRTLVGVAPGSEGYDRILLLSDPFAGGRRVRASILYSKGSLPQPGMLQGYGLLALWGGHNGVGSPMPGWRYGLAWYYSKPAGFGLELSYRQGSKPHDSKAAYQPFVPEPGRVEELLVEAWPERLDGAGLRWRMRAKRWFAGEAEPEHWIELADEAGARLPAGRYSVGFLAHRCSAGILRAKIEAIDPR
ncbi:MAG: hypothetical protein CSA62_00500 [Planctomycetota bacterium]|nr:MAG: hypothetical protein CSA62_00500 [Planctomycetota bacterium]